MRLLDTGTHSFRIVNDPRKVRYAILSHVWHKGPEGDPLEQSYLDVCRAQASAAALSEKLERFCNVAKSGGFDLAWADSCCIDKTSSSELSEAINSMYDWYRYADACYVYLHDVSTNLPPEEMESQFVDSEWHRRGWTLQELLAPRIVLFMSAEWHLIGSKLDLAGLIQRATRIPRSVLTFETPVTDCSVACRMSWAASRETTKVEDQAYSLLGIFGVNMPATYGEGCYAFIRLQREILKNIQDQTIFAWGTILEHHTFSFFGRPVSTANPRVDAFPVPDSSPQYLLAASPREFEHSADFRPVVWHQFLSRLGLSVDEPSPMYAATSLGIRTRLPLLPVIAVEYETNLPSHLAILACERDTHAEGPRLVAILLRPQAVTSSTDFLASAVVGRMADLIQSHRIQPDSHIPDIHRHHYRLAYLTSEQISTVVAEQAVLLKDVCIPYRPSQLSDGLTRDASFHTALCQATSFKILICDWSKELLALRGYDVRISGYRSQAAFRPSGDALQHDVHMTSGPAMITIVGPAGIQYSIKVCHCACHFGTKQSYLSVTVSSNWARSGPKYYGPGLPASGTPHSMDDPSHVYSWNHGSGVASQRFELLPISRRERVIMQLTISRANNASSASSESTHYALGIEIWDGRGEYLRGPPSSVYEPSYALDDYADSPPISASSSGSDAPSANRAGDKRYRQANFEAGRNGRGVSSTALLRQHRAARQNSSKVPVVDSGDEYVGGYIHVFESEGILPFMSADDEEFTQPPSPPLQHGYLNGVHPGRQLRSGRLQVPSTTMASTPLLSAARSRGQNVRIRTLTAESCSLATRDGVREAASLTRTAERKNIDEFDAHVMDKSATQVTAAVPVALPVAADSSDIMTDLYQDVAEPPVYSPTLQLPDRVEAKQPEADVLPRPSQVVQSQSTEPTIPDIHDHTPAAAKSDIPQTSSHGHPPGGEQMGKITLKDPRPAFATWKRLSTRITTTTTEIFRVRKQRSAD
ncbi:hypothetical protein C8Q70DRAFT_371644 [Cubamyces menziesii]|nr:hypothetical protein C8Q70DRAFT_371644 [Cubamyces menziesii]